MVGDDGHLIIRDPLGEPVPALDDGHEPGLVLIGDRVSPARAGVSVCFDELPPRRYRFARRAGLLGHQPAEHVADAAVGEVGLGLLRCAAVRSDEDAVLIDEAVGELLGRGLDPEELGGLAVGLEESPFAQGDLPRRAIVAGFDLAEVDDDVPGIVLVVSDDYRPVDAGLLADDDGEAIRVLAGDGEGRGCGEDAQENPNSEGTRFHLIPISASRKPAPAYFSASQRT